MRSKIIVLFLSLFLLASTPGWAADRGALFKITSGTHTMHLYGTMHIGVPEFFPLEPRITGAIAGASTVALEVDPLADPARMMVPVRQHAMYAPGSTDAASMPAALKVRLVPVLKRAGMSLEMTAPFKPWMVAVMLGIHEFVALGYNPNLSVDKHVAELARASKVPLLELETMDAQLALFGNLPLEQQWSMLEETVAMIESGRQRAEVEELTAAWRNGDQKMLDAVALRMENDKSAAGKFFQKSLLEGRNGPMADKLEKLLKTQQNTVAAIGVLHLVGKQSVTEMLRARGLKVERVY
jgi:uncharacterized protein YbaP (TraB family)